MQIQGFEDVLYVKNFSLKKRSGDHSNCKFVAAIKVDDVGKYIGKVGKQICVMLNNGRRPIFFGRIEEVEVEKTFSRTCIRVSAVSETQLIDEEPVTRIFQNPDKTFSDVLNKSRLKLNNCNLQLDDTFANFKPKVVILQNQETNFQFIKRLAESRNFKTWVIDTKNTPEIRVSKCLDESAIQVKSEEIIRLSKRHNKKIPSARLTLYRFIDIGRIIQLIGVDNDVQKYLINSLELYQEGSADRFDYELEEFKIQPLAQVTDKALEKVVKFKAKIKDVNDPENLGRVQVDFDNNEVEDNDDKKLWIPYRSPYSGTVGGIVFLPDVGDEVEIFFTNGECYACSTLRKNPLSDECKNVKDKYIGNNFKQRIIWKEKSLEINSFNNKIELDEKKIELTVGKNSLRLDDNGITIKTTNDEVVLTGGKIIIKSGTVKIGDKVELA